MRYIKLFENYQSKEEIDDICTKCRIKNYTINPDGSIDVDGSVDLYYRGLTKLPLKFNKVTGYFYCNDNSLTTLEGCPNYVGGSFYCSYNNLTNLEGSPSYVGEYFSCANNKLTTLEGCPETIKGDAVSISDNPLPQEIYDNISDIKYIMEYGEDYGIWRNGQLSIPRFNRLIKEKE